MAKAVLIISDVDEETGTLNVSLEFDPPLKNQEGEKATLAQSIAMSFLNYIKGKAKK